MSKKKGLSLEEKRSRMTEFFYEKKDFFQLKDLEKLCPKEKGITSMSVKEVVQSLVDDGIVDTDKIGTSIYFWAFPSKSSQNRKRKLDELDGKLKALAAKKEQLLVALEKAKIGKEDSDERVEVIEELNKRKAEKAALNAEIEKYKDSDPSVLEKYKQEAEQAKEAANRWTDNIFSTKSWIKNKFSFEESVLDKQFGIPADFDYVE
ncbi:meiotic nuclear division protein 1 [Biomphalaria glabrata]|uniref:Meiotic nuclear division protein 1 homolog n=2 Tax=Biomphalaria glabrata TaxID=6526 RepID=A0A2C9JYA7_BIOGL|nr:meiotic nuclear division protein 1 homolog isoform X1 [Biomphalaria glabrata]KAI8753002.1 putative meiotic nuclear division protein 1 [Biomphalaria glabrata]